MSASYYYFIASLPVLSFDSKPPFSYDDFLRACGEQLSSKDFSTIKSVRINEDGKAKKAKSILRDWIEFNRNFRNEIAKFRAVRAGKNPQAYLRGEKTEDFSLTDIVLQASKSENPLSAEKLLDKVRWQKLEELSFGHYFDLEWLMIYILKLQILERYQVAEISKGQEVLEKYKQTVLSN